MQKETWMIKHSIVNLLRAINSAVKSGAEQVPDFLEEFIRFVGEWAGLLLVIVIAILLLDVFLAFLYMR